jgi:hypothetical protein
VTERERESEREREREREEGQFLAKNFEEFLYMVISKHEVDLVQLTEPVMTGSMP